MYVRGATLRTHTFFAENLSMTPQPQPDTVQEVFAEKKPFLYPAVILNCVVVVGLATLFWGKNLLWSACVTPWVGAVSQALMIVAIFQLAWSFLKTPLSKATQKTESLEISILKVTLSPELFVNFFNALHLSFLSPPALWASSILILFLSGWAGGSSFSPFLIFEETPFIQNFSVLLVSGEAPQTLSPKDELSLADNQTARITATILPASDVSCKWSTLRGSVLPGGNCSVQYVPQTRGNDVLTLEVQSACKTQTTVSSLFITLLGP